MMRSIEQHADFVGRPTRVGSAWRAKDPNTGLSKQMRVVSEERCGAAKCLRVRREYDVDRKALFDEISDNVAAYLQSQGGDPSDVKITGTDVKLEDPRDRLRVRIDVVVTGPEDGTSPSSGRQCSPVYGGDYFPSNLNETFTFAR